VFLDLSGGPAFTAVRCYRPHWRFQRHGVHAKRRGLINNSISVLCDLMFLLL